jgi:hypothetical protein
MKRVVLMIISALICGMLYTSCSSNELQGEIPDEPQKGITEESQNGTAEDLQGEITYPKYGKYGRNILADDFVEATQMAEYSLSADLSDGNSSLKIVIRSITETETGRITEWGGYYPHSLDNWLASSWDDNLKGNTFIVYESGKIAHAAVAFVSDCIIEYYKNGATEPAKVKKIKVIQDEIPEESQNGTTEDLQGEITYPKYGKYGRNILADDFVEAAQMAEYSLSADLSADNSSLKIVIRSITETETGRITEWGGYYPHSLDNWLASSWDDNLKGNTFTVYESGKTAHAAVTFVSDCIIEYYENGAAEPAKVKEIKVIQDEIPEEPQDKPAEDLQGEITYPKYGKYGLNILADDFVEATQTGNKLVEYSMSADLSAGNSSLKIVIRSITPIEWGGILSKQFG